jgi:regulator of replication initiation timing
LTTPEVPALRRGVFGYRRDAVDRIILDRDVMLRQAEAKLTTAESRVTELEAELAGLRAQNGGLIDSVEQLRTELEHLQSRLAEVPPQPPPPDPGRQITSEFLADELTRVLASAEESARRIVDRARHSSEQQIVEADRMWREALRRVAGSSGAGGPIGPRPDRRRPPANGRRPCPDPGRAGTAGRRHRRAGSRSGRGHLGQRPTPASHLGRSRPPPRQRTGTSGRGVSPGDGNRSSPSRIDGWSSASSWLTRG